MRGTTKKRSFLVVPLTGRFAAPSPVGRGISFLPFIRNKAASRAQCSMNMPKAYMVPSSVLKYTRPLEIDIPASDAGPAMRLRLE